MPRIDELISAEFARWEQRGRGWRVWSTPVQPEPLFEEFNGYSFPTPQPEIDDGRRPGLFASLFDSVQQQLAPKPPLIVAARLELEPTQWTEPLTTEFVLSVPTQLDVPSEVMRAFLSSLDSSGGPTAFELFGTGNGVAVHFASSPSDARPLRRQLAAFLSELPITVTSGALAESWTSLDGESFVVDFGLAHEFMLPLQKDHSIDPFVDLIAVLGELNQDEAAVLQVLFRPAQHPWSPSIWRSVTDRSGAALFANRIPLIPGTKEKLSAPLFGVVVRLAARAAEFERAAAIVRDMACTFRAFARPENNHLIPLNNSEYPFDLHEEDLLNRLSRRSGMLLNRDELLGFVHLPGDEVRSPRLRRQTKGTREAPASVTSSRGVLLGHNEHCGRRREVRLNAEQRVRHTHILGATGTGKSTLLFNLIQQDIVNGEGVAVLDPHGDLVDRVLGVIPESRINDVVLFDPTDEQYSIGFNILAAHSDFEKNLLASDLVSIFRRLSSSWGDQMNSVLNNAILAFLESPKGGTLADLRRFLLDAEFRNRVLESIADPEIGYYWRKAFPQLGGNKSVGPILTRLDTFLGRKTIRYMVSQPKNRLDFAHILDSGKIFLAKLPQGQIGHENSLLLGSLLMSKFQQLTMSRQRLDKEQRRDFWLYIDEFHHFITPSMTEVLTGARKYRLGLILAHHELHQLQRDSTVAGAVMTHPFMRIVFRVSDDDARVLEKGFASFEARDLQNLVNGTAICRVERSDNDFNVTVPLPVEPDPSAAVAMRDKVVAASRSRYGTPRSEIEEALQRVAPIEPAPTPPTPLPVSEKPVVTESVSRPPIVLPPVKPAEPPKPLPPETPVVRPVLPPKDLGRGGAQHQALQRRIKAAAEEKGFKSTIEKQILQGQGSIDLLLERDDRSIACEISITTTVDHEVGNVVKCLKAEFKEIAIVSIDETHLRKIQAAVNGTLGAEAQAYVSYYHPDAFLSYLQSLPVPKNNETPKMKVRRGFRVKRSSSNLSPEEQDARREAATRVIAEAMKQEMKGATTKRKTR